ncbi:MAG: hydrogenase, partial [Planctomycetota bacterium]|nr:hydrogenase [Planctomycetota bacterium]
MTTITVQDLPEDPRQRAPIVEGEHDFATVTNAIARVTEMKTPRGWYVLFGISVAAFVNLFAMIGYLFWTGVGVWGNTS